MITSLDLIATLCAGLLVGVEFAVSAFVNPVLWQLDDRAQSRAIRLFADKLGTVMPFWYAATLVLLAIETAVRWHERARALLITSIVIWLAVIVLTIFFLVPINSRLARLDPESSFDKSRKEHKGWDTRHRLRILAIGTALVCFLVAIHG